MIFVTFLHFYRFFLKNDAIFTDFWSIIAFFESQKLVENCIHTLAQQVDASRAIFNLRNVPPIWNSGIDGT
jgi:hypothetical protein